MKSLVGAVAGVLVAGAVCAGSTITMRSLLEEMTAPGDVGVCLFSEGGKMKVRALKAWTMAASNPW
jgi:hypothetical protein